MRAEYARAGRRPDVRISKLFFAAIAIMACSRVAAGQSLSCDMKEYKPIVGVEAEVRAGVLEVTWPGERGETLRAEFAIRDGQPVVRELSAQKKGGAWIVLGSDLAPEFQVTSGMRRLSDTQANEYKRLPGGLTPELAEEEKWNAFWDAPLNVPRTEGGEDRSLGLPRKPEEIRRATASFHATGCQVRTNGARVEVSFAGLDMGIFSGRLQFTMYRGSNLFRVEAIAETNEPSVAYRYAAGLKGFHIGADTRVLWRDTARTWQETELGGAVNTDNVSLRARNRLGIVESGGGALGFFPAPHKFFFARENDVNLGYVYYRKDSESSFAVGVTQPERGDGDKPVGVSEAVWTHRVQESRSQTGNFALYNAPPGTWQRMAVYFYLSAESGRATQQDVAAYTHDDTYKPMPGFEVLTSHFHFHLLEMLNDRGSLDYRPQWADVFRGIGINIVILADFHSDSHPDDPGAVREKEQQVYFQGCARLSDKNFLVIPGEEPNAYLGGHYMMLLPHPVYWTHAPARLAGQSFVENDPAYGTVYHAQSAEDVTEILGRENGIIWQAHPETKSSAGYPRAVRSKDYFLSDRFIGASWESLPVDLSEERLCQVRCFGTLDDMNEWSPTPKYMIAEGDTYQTFPEDDLYAQLAVNYVRLAGVPKFSDGWAPVVHALQSGDYFVTTGEILLHSWGIEGQGAKSVYTADAEWTFPLEFAELVWSDGSAVHRQIIPATEMQAFGRHTFRIPFDATGKKWVRFAVWDAAGNGAFTQPVRLK
jgi:hypothetical protein